MEVNIHGRFPGRPCIHLPVYSRETIRRTEAFVEWLENEGFTATFKRMAGKPEFIECRFPADLEGREIQKICNAMKRLVWFDAIQAVQTV